jgi:DNA-binding transcriptional regulator YiaG
MKTRKRAKLEAHGWHVGSAAEFLALSPEEAALVDTKVALSRSLRARRTKQGMSQTALARYLKSSQSRVAKLEAADPSVSVDLLLRALFALGATPRDIAKALQSSGASAAA